MKFLILSLLSISLVSCASYREPSSINNHAEQEDVSRGISSDNYYFTR